MAMLDSEMAEGIVALTRSFWQKEIHTEEFARIAAGKEIGHRIADLVDEKTTALIEHNFDTKYERKRDGSTMVRSMGDIWVLSNGIYNPINVKSGEAGKKGQPNMVSLKKLLRALLKRQIDSYYLLIIKMVLTGDIRASVYFVDILSYLEYVTFDSGPGQIMLREGKFYDAMDRGIALAPLTMERKIAGLFTLLEEADQRLMANRKKVLETIREMRPLYDSTKDLDFDQSGLHLR